MYFTIRVAKTKALISFAVTAKLTCVFVFAYANSQFSHIEAHIIAILSISEISSLYLAFLFVATDLSLSWSESKKKRISLDETQLAME